MSEALIKSGEAEGSLERRRAFVQGCAAVTIEQVHVSFPSKMFWSLILVRNLDYS